MSGVNPPWTASVGSVTRSGVPEPTFRASWELQPDTAMASEARRRTAEALRRWGCDALIPDAQLVITELVTNAIVHTGAVSTVTIELEGNTLYIEVADTDPNPPRPQPFDLTREGGRGLLIVATLANAWGIEPHASGKKVWAELAS